MALYESISLLSCFISTNLNLFNYDVSHYAQSLYSITVVFPATTDCRRFCPFFVCFFLNFCMVPPAMSLT